MIIVENGLFGFVGMDGVVAVQPRFVEVSAFRGGRAAARETSLFGYIDRTGAWIIEPRYDYATVFSEGVAAVWVEGRVQFIDTSGRVLHQGDYTEVRPCKGGYMEVKRAEASGLITRDGVVLAEPGVPYYVLDSTHALVGDHVDDWRAEVQHPMVWRLVTNRGAILQSYHGYDKVISTRGAPVFVLSTEVSRNNWEYERTYDVFTVNGEPVNEMDTSQAKHIRELLPCGHMLGTQDEYHSATRTTGSRQVIIDHTGGIVVLPRTERGYTVTYGDSAFLYVDRKANKVLHLSCTGGGLSKRQWTVSDFSQVDLNDRELQPDLRQYHNQFDRMYAVGRNNGTWSILDEKGRWTAPLDYTKDHSVMHVSDDRIYTFRSGSDNRADQVEIFDRRNGGQPIATIPDVKAVITVWNGGLSVIAGNKQKVVDRNGAAVWTSAPYAWDHVRSYGYSHKPEVWRAGDPDSAKPLASLAVEAIRAQRLLPTSFSVADPVHLVAINDVSSPTPMVYVVNGSANEVSFATSDSRLYLVMEARRTQRDEWSEIEYLPSSWCGNSYYDVALPPRSYWSFPIERYRGSVPVECRMKLTIQFARRRLGDETEREEKVIYSNPFAMSVNPAQLWRVREHERMGLMDPY